MTAVFPNNTLIIPSQPTIVPDCPRSVIGFRSLLPTSTILNSDEDALYPFSNCLDYRDNTQYSPVSTSTVTIEFRQTTASEVDYFGIAIHNGATVSMTGSFEVQVLGVWVEVSTFNALIDNKTIMGFFDKKVVTRQRLILTYVGKLFIGTIFVGKSWEFEKTPDLGFTPGDTNNLDEVQQFYADAGQFIIGRKIEKGFGTKGQFSNINFDVINVEYVEYMNHVKMSRPVFLKWNTSIDNNFFGQQDPNRLVAPKYDRFNRGTITFHRPDLTNECR